MSFKSLRPHLSTVLKGMAMGAADIVPGVSGGTIAFITGIYERLLKALKSCTPMALLLLKTQGVAAFWRHIDGTFLLSLFGGVITSIALFSHLISAALEQYPLQVWGFFFGLIITSAVYLAKTIDLIHWRPLLLIVLGAAAAVVFASIKPVDVPVNVVTVFLSGAIAICAMILPGVSGSFLLLVMGMYSVMINAVTEGNFVLLGVFFAGCVFGLLAFSHLLHWLLQRFHQSTIAVLTGFLFGAAVVVWPWKHVLQTQLNRHGEEVVAVQENVWPWVYESLNGQNPQLLSVMLLALVGALLMLFVEWVAKIGRNRPL
ncbi:DUF368 domain-containing protein [Gilvimarinus sp. SDUM040013]|uniref:DUF368 domain-containing protein n=1 Tax=Gilvimarinus gilvus TaxID=3058038 RepID=A0ABU4S4D4_9GAMM|nr:DUF368 domain-containing protein [Gilvimarinus sp. SDUM040013]MDO3384477.1 DUF368 domain-containing protein [Gilvimarinus sp. SDUM040013]MDX6850718.1 DUF368 domain-containing protein [Gilvimarinus sp. SDUM040013]